MKVLATVASPLECPSNRRLPAYITKYEFRDSLPYVLVPDFRRLIRVTFCDK